MAAYLFSVSQYPVGRLALVHALLRPVLQLRTTYTVIGEQGSERGRERVSKRVVFIILEA